MGIAAFATPLLAAPGAVAADVRPLGAPGPIGTERLSDERTITRFANARTRNVIRARPMPRARTVARLRPWTESGYREVYLVLRGRRDRLGRLWLEIRVPGRPNGRRGWVLRGSLGQLRAVRTRLVVDRRRLRATLFRGGRPIWRSRIGVGTPATPTPRGAFYVRELLRVPPGTIYGPWAFGTSASVALSDWPGGGVVGVHGTNQPELIPGRPSKGCIRVPNRAIRRLARLMPIGTPVRIL